MKEQEQLILESLRSYSKITALYLRSVEVDKREETLKRINIIQDTYITSFEIDNENNNFLLCSTGFRNKHKHTFDEVLNTLKI